MAAPRSEPEQEIPAPAPLRRPRSPEPARRDDGSDRAPTKFGPPGSATTSAPTNQGGPRNAGPRGYQNRANQSFDSSRNQDNRNQDNMSRFNRSAEGDMERSNAGPSNDRNRGYQNDRNDGRKLQDRLDRNRAQDGDNNRQNSRPGYDRKPRQNDEDWGSKPAQKPQEAKPAVKPTPPQAPREEPKVETPLVKASNAPRPLASAADVQPVAAKVVKLVPKNCVVELLPAGATFIVSVDAKDEDSDNAWLCLACHEDFADSYQQLFEPLAEMCEASEVYQPRPGDTFGYLDPEDGGWYRARCLAAARCALLDAGRCVRPAPGNCRRLPAACADIPEFCVRVEGALQLGSKLDCTIVSKSNGILTVSLVNQETGASLGKAKASRWLPEVELPKEPAPVAKVTSPSVSAKAPQAAATPSTSGPVAHEIPRVPRPPVAHKSTVVLVDATEPARVFVRPAQRDSQALFDDLICEVALYGMDENTPRMKELPTAGQTVVASFTDGVYYRALVQRVSSKHKRCLLEYVEYGNVAAVELDNLRPCPPQFELANKPTLTSLVTLQMTQKAFTEAATAYLDKLKDDGSELTLSIPSGEKSGRSATPVRLRVVKSGEDVNRAVDSLSTPDWKKILERGGDVLETERICFEEVKYVDPPLSGGEIEVIDSSTLSAGCVAGHERGAEHARRVHALTAQMLEYCNSALAKDPYLPKTEELCIAKNPDNKQWLRGVISEQEGGPGGASAQVLFYDLGVITSVPVADIRKMMREFSALPAAAVTLEIKDFPKDPTPAQLERAKLHMQLTERGTGFLRTARCTRVENGFYLVEAPELIQAMQ